MSQIPNKITRSLRKRLEKHSVKKIDESVTLSSVFKKYNGECQECGIIVEYSHPPKPNSASIEHIVPLSIGGSHTWDNIELLCHKCNTGRNASSPTSKVKHVKRFRLFGYTINITKGN